MNSRIWIPLASAVFLAGTLAGGATAAERVFKWVDKDGVVHYGQQPPVTEKSEAIKVQKGYSTPAEDEPAPAAAPAQSGTVTQDEYCGAATKNFEMLSGTEVVTRKDESGAPHVLTPEERETERSKAKAAMELYCKPAEKPK